MQWGSYTNHPRTHYVIYFQLSIVCRNMCSSLLFGGLSPQPTLHVVRRALNVLSEHDVASPDEVHLEIIVTAALEARRLFFAVATEKPADPVLAIFFDGFVLTCVGRSADGRPFQDSMI